MVWIIAAVIVAIVLGVGKMSKSLGREHLDQIESEMMQDVRNTQWEIDHGYHDWNEGKI